ncbi:MAG: serine hydrolase [Caldilineaceae bacterium]
MPCSESAASANNIATAVAKLMLVSAGRLSLDKTLADYLPELVGRVDNADRITLKMMVQHRSGIPNFTDAAAWDWFTSQTDIDKALALVLDQPADFRAWRATTTPIPTIC